MTVKRFRSRFYLNKRDGKLLGVCAGIADHLGIEPLWVRVATVALTLLVSFVTIPIYVIIALLADPRPAALYHADPLDDALAERSSARTSRMRGEVSDLDRRLADVEDFYRRSNARLAGEIDRLR